MHKTLRIDGADQHGRNDSVRKDDAQPSARIRTKHIGDFFCGHPVSFSELSRVAGER
jgi:hypothetical protein